MSRSIASSEFKVRELIERYRDIQDPHPIVAELFSSPQSKATFQDALNHEHFIIRSRSQDLSRSEITIAQKAFVQLIESGVDYYAATAIWVEEVLGLNVLPTDTRLGVLASVVKAKSLIIDSMDSPLLEIRHFLSNKVSRPSRTPTRRMLTWPLQSIDQQSGGRIFVPLPEQSCSY